MERKQLLLEEIKNESNNPFNHYLYALELIKENNEKDAEDKLDDLIKNFPEYLPTYYTFANFLIQKDNEEKSLNIAKAGVIIANKQKNNKTLKELEQFILIYS